MSQPFALSCRGGLNVNLNQLEIMRQPGLATKLLNFEVDPDGGYRRISGFNLFGGGSSARPNSSNAILGMAVYADGLVVCSGTGIFFSQDGTSWIQINKASVSGSGDNLTTFNARSNDDRTGQGQCTFSIFEGTTDYGDLLICDGANKPFFFRMTGTGNLSTRTFFAGEITVDGTTAPSVGVMHENHFVVGGASTAKNTIFFSSSVDPDSFSGSGAGSIQLTDSVVGLASFRSDLVIFCTNSIFRLVNISDSTNIAVVPVTRNVGCLDGQSIQEIGGDLLFLSPDGIRTFAGTARIGDVELGTVSKAIQPLLTDLTESINSFIINSLVLRDKSQYRLFYTNTSLENSQQKGIIGTLRPDGFQWSETRGLEVTAIGSGFDNNNVEQYYHGDTNGFVYQHDTGNDFDGTNILARYETPNYDYGDLGTLKTLHFIRVSASSEGITEPNIQVRFDYGSGDIPQPPDLFDLGVINPPSKFGDAIFNTNVFGGADNPLIRVPLQGSGTSNNFTIISEDSKPPYTINGFYVDYIPSGRR